MPVYPGGFSGGDTALNDYRSTSWFLRLTSDYTGLSFLEVRELPYIQYLTWRRDAYITYLNSFEEGREYLDNAWRMEQTKPDRAKLRAKLARKEAQSDGKQH